MQDAAFEEERHPMSDTPMLCGLWRPRLWSTFFLLIGETRASTISESEIVPLHLGASGVIFLEGGRSHGMDSRRRAADRSVTGRRWTLVSRYSPPPTPYPGVRRCRQVPWRYLDDPAPGQSGAFPDLWPARPGGWHAGRARDDLSYLLHDQAHRQRRPYDAVRRGALSA